MATFRKKEKFWHFWPKFAQKWILGSEIQKSKSGFQYTRTPPIHHVCQFLAKMNDFWFFGLNLGKSPNYVQYFGSNIVEPVAETWVEAGMNWVEVDGAGWSWVEVDGAGWSLVHGLVIPICKSNYHNVLLYLILSSTY